MDRGWPPGACPGQTCSLDPGGYGAAMSWYPPDDACVTDTANLRGGSFASSAADAQTIRRERRGSLRASSTPLGFRCAKTKP